LLTDYNGNIVGNDEISMIVTNYDYTSILSVNKDVVFNQSVTGIHTNSKGEDTYMAKADKNLLDRGINLIIKPANKISKSKRKLIKKIHNK